MADELDPLLDELRGAVADNPDLSDDDRDHLHGLVQRVETATAADEVDEGLQDHIDESLARFEVEHVGLVYTINRIANLLSASGI